MFAGRSGLYMGVRALRCSAVCRVVHWQFPGGCRVPMCVWLVAWLCVLVMDEEVVIRTAVVGCLLCFLCVHRDAVV